MFHFIIALFRPCFCFVVLDLRGSAVWTQNVENTYFGMFFFLNMALIGAICLPLLSCQLISFPVFFFASVRWFFDFFVHLIARRLCRQVFFGSSRGNKLLCVFTYRLARWHHKSLFFLHFFLFFLQHNDSAIWHRPFPYLNHPSHNVMYAYLITGHLSRIYHTSSSYLWMMQRENEMLPLSLQCVGALTKRNINA